MIRCIGGITEADIEREVRNIISLLRNGENANIISILDHGVLGSTSDCYYIDMELCDFTLHEYIKSRSGGVSCVLSIPIHDSMAPVFVRNDCTSLMRTRNIWEIAIHIACGLEFMHSHAQVHRDVKPSNGRSYEYKADSVLYNRRQNAWKLTDFGLSSEATSKNARTTEHGFGTPCYRAPELLRDEGRKFTNKVDMWGLGCIIYELTTSKVAFRGDYFTREYLLDNHAKVSLGETSLSSFLEHHIEGIILELLSRQWNKRPSASRVLVRLRSYSQLFSHPIAERLIDIHSYPSFSEWRALLDSPDLLSSLLKIYYRNNETEAVRVVGKLIREQDTTQNLNDMISLWEYLANVFHERREYSDAIGMYQLAIDQEPSNYRLWRSICKAYVAGGDHAGAVAECKRRISQQPKNWAPVMEFCNLSATQGNYRASIQAYIQLYKNGSNESLWESLQLDRLVLTGEDKYLLPLVQS